MKNSICLRFIKALPGHCLLAFAVCVAVNLNARAIVPAAWGATTQARPGTLPDPQIRCKLATEAENGLSNADVTLKAVQNSCSGSCSDQTEASSDSPDAGNYSFCPCLNCTEFDVVPYKNNDPLNGVSTFDLVLINKHILGLEPLNSLYKMIAADANNSRSITTFDIVELRKLILGLYTTLPNNTSWRFVYKDYIFPNPINPFEELFPETKTVDLSSNPIQEADFVAVKVGDVNGNVVTTSFLLRPVTTIAIPALEAAKAGQVITVPVRYSGAGPLEAFQLGLRFDPATLSLIGPSQGDLPGYNAGNFGLTRAAQGEIRTLWFADPSVPGEALYPGDVLFYLSFRVKAPRSEAAAPLLQVDDDVLLSAAWNAGGAEYALRCGAEPDQRVAPPAEAPAALQATCHPNPASGETQLTLRSDRAGHARIGLYDAFGKRECEREVTLTAGEQTFALPQSAQLPAGVYFWKVLTPWAKAQGHWIKQ